MGRTTRDETRPTAGPKRHPSPERRTMPAGGVLVAMLVCLTLWTVLFSPSLKRSAEASPEGARRSVSLAVLGPVAALSDALRLSAVTDAVEEALGRDDPELPGVGVVEPPEPIPTVPGDDAEGPNQGDPKPTGPIRVPTGTKKLRVVVVGDSLAAGLGTYLERVMKPSLVRVSRQGQISTGLARPDYFDWPATMQEIVDRFKPDLVLVMIGKNDTQSLRTPGGRVETEIATFGWPDAYAERVRDFMSIATSGGARVVWVGLPVIRDEARWEIIRRQNEVFEEAARAEPDVSYLDTWDLYSTPSGGYTAYLHQGNDVIEIRASDGLHFTPTGYELLARAALQLAVADFQLAEKTIAD
jgi:hypothetical protein